MSTVPHSSVTRGLSRDRLMATDCRPRRWCPLRMSPAPCCAALSTCRPRSYFGGHARPAQEAGSGVACCRGPSPECWTAPCLPTASVEMRWS